MLYLSQVRREKTRLGASLGLLALILMSPGAMQAQFTYTFSSLVGSGPTAYTQVSAGGSDLNSIEVNDAHSATIGLGFNFGYNGATVNQVRVNSNGWISLDASDTPTASEGRDNSTFSSANGEVRPAICPLWDDLDGVNGTARYETTGSAPNRVFTMEWRNWQWNQAANNFVISFQCKLYETTNVIEFVYRQEANPVVSGSASIGLLATASGSYYSLNGTGGSPTASTSSATTSLSTRPATNQIYRFTPSCGTATNITAISSNSPICAGSTLNLSLTAAGTAPLTYAWTGTGTFSSTAAEDPTVTGAATGSYSVTVRNWCGTTDTDNTAVTVVPAPTTSNAGADQTICIGGGATLAANIPANGTGNWSIQAVSGGATNNTSQFSSLSSNTATFTPLTAGTYTLRWTIANAPCTSSTNDMVLTVRALPTTANAGPDQSICQLSGIATMAANTATSGTGTWTQTGGPITGAITTATSPTTTITGLTTAGFYTFRWTIANSPCAASFDEVQVEVKPNPVATASSNTPVCAGSSLDLTGSSDLVATSFAWTGPNGFTSTMQNPSVATPTVAATGVYWFIATLNGCSSLEANTVVTVSPVPTSVNVTPSTPTICANSNVGLTATGTVANGHVVFNGAGMNIPEAGPTNGSLYPSPITVSGLPTSGVSVKSVTIRGLTHSYPDDLDILLRFGTSGSNYIMLMSDHGDQFDVNKVNYTFDDAASGALSGTAFNPSGTYDPANSGTGETMPSPAPGFQLYSTAPLSTFTGNLNGTWNLFVRDDADEDGGSIEGWTIVFNVPGGLTYTWSPASGLSGTSGSSVTAAPTTTQTYTVTATANPGSCTSTGTSTVNVVALPNPGANNTLTACSIDAATDMSALLGAHDTGTWSGPSPVIGDMYDPATMSPGNYVYTVSAPPCADATATITVTENIATPRYLDSDGDGYGDPNDSVQSCSPIAGRVSNNLDCDDDELQYADTDGDGFGAGSPVACGVSNNADDCPTVVGVIGSNCDANPSPFGFTLGQLNNSCTCAPIACSENITLELRTDLNSQQASWEILDQNLNFVVCGGGGYPPNINTPITDNCCLPVGCYRLRVMDSGGDGFVTGGYQLRESGINGRRIIDNLANFSNGTTSAISNSYDNGAFCLPVGNDRPIFASCDKLDWVNNQFIVATENSTVSTQYGVNNANSGYEFWFFDPNGTYSYRRFRSHATSDGFGHGATRACHFKLNGWINNLTNPHLPANTTLNVRIRGRVNGSNLPFGPACLFKMDAVRAACPLVKLQDNPLYPDFSCGVNKVFGGGASSANRITANPPQFQPAPLAGGTALRYQFRFRIPGEIPMPGSCIVRPPQTSPTLNLNWTTGEQLRCNTTYEVDVRVSKDGGATWCVDGTNPACSGVGHMAWGKVCNVNITTSTNCPGPLQGGANSMAIGDHGTLTMYPNPNTGEQLFLNLSRVEEGTTTVSVDIFDMTGKRVIARTIPVLDGSLNTGVELTGDVRSGVYLVNITAGTKTYTERLVVQR